MKKIKNVFSTNTVDIDTILNVKPKIKFKMIIPEQYRGYLNVFDENETNQLPPIRGKKFNHEIELLEKKGKNQRSLGPVIQYVKKRISGIEKTLIEYSDKSFIRINDSPVAAPIFIVKKPDGSLHFCVDYRNFNRFTEKDKYFFAVNLRNFSKY